MTRLTRRRVLQMGAGSLAAAALGARPAHGQSRGGDAVTLRASSRIIDVHGKPARVLGISQDNGVGGLFDEKGGHFRVELVNELGTETLIHWHGLTPPSEQDGVPGLSQPALPPGDRYHYDFVHNRAGTHWMHSHLGLQEQQLLAAPLIVRDPAETHLDEQEVVILLHDFSFRAPEEIFEQLRRDAGMSMPVERHGGHQGHGAAPVEGGTMGMSQDQSGGMGQDHSGGMSQDHTVGMGQDQSGEMGQDHGAGMVHFNDVEYDAYLANDRSLSDPEVVRVEPAGLVRLRIINAAAATSFLIDLGALDGQLIAVDGNPVVPLHAKQFDLAIAQRVDLRLRLPSGQGTYPVLARREDATEQTGVILATRGGRIERLPEQGVSKSRPLNLELEGRLSAISALRTGVAARAQGLDLTGTHAGYDWGLNGKVFDPADPIYVRRGERNEITLRNKTAMPHPIHLHGHHFQVVAIDGRRFSGAVRDTVLVPPTHSVTIAFDADNPGHWAFHCHQLYHMAAGMMTSVRYEGYEPV